MSNPDSVAVAGTLPPNPNLRHLKDQAEDLLKAGQAQTLSAAQFKLARTYGFASWPKLKAYVDSLSLVGELKAAIDAEDLPLVKRLMTRYPDLHRAPIGYGDDGPLTWVAECRVPSETRLEMARWMIENGSDVHQGGDGPLMRAALSDERIPMMELLVRYGADVDARWHGFYPILWALCETLAAEALRWLTMRWRSRADCWSRARTRMPVLRWMRRASAARRLCSMPSSLWETVRMRRRGCCWSMGPIRMCGLPSAIN